MLRLREAKMGNFRPRHGLWIIWLNIGMGRSIRGVGGLVRRRFGGCRRSWSLRVTNRLLDHKGV